MKKMCSECGKHRALAISHHTRSFRSVRQIKGHDLCFQCTQAIKDRIRYKPMATQAQPKSRLIEFDDSTHTYFVDGDAKISTTQVLRDAGMIDTTWFREWHRWRGSETHKAIATWNKAGKIDKRTIDPKIRPYLDAALKWQADTKFIPMFVEERRHDSIFDICGTADLIGYFAGSKPTVDVFCDFKTNDHKMGQATSRYQLASYGHMFDPKGIFRRIEVVLGPDGYGPVNSFPVDSYIADVNTFHAMVIVAKLRRELGLTE